MNLSDQQLKGLVARIWWISRSFFRPLPSIRTVMITDHCSYRLSINGKINKSVCFDIEVVVS